MTDIEADLMYANARIKELEAENEKKPTHKRGICSPTKLPCSECMPTTCDCEIKEE